MSAGAVSCFCVMFLCHGFLSDFEVMIGHGIENRGVHNKQEGGKQMNCVMK